MLHGGSSQGVWGRWGLTQQHSTLPLLLPLLHFHKPLPFPSLQQRLLWCLRLAQWTWSCLAAQLRVGSGYCQLARHLRCRLGAGVAAAAAVGALPASVALVPAPPSRPQRLLQSSLWLQRLQQPQRPQRGQGACWPPPPPPQRCSLEWEGQQLQLQLQLLPPRPRAWRRSRQQLLLQQQRPPPPRRPHLPVPPSRPPPPRMGTHWHSLPCLRRS